MILAALLAGWGDIGGKRLFPLAGYFTLGFSVYLYLPLATIHSPLVSWGDGTTVRGFMRHILRVEYGSFRLSADADEPGR